MSLYIILHWGKGRGRKSDSRNPACDFTRYPGRTVISRAKCLLPFPHFYFPLCVRRHSLDSCAKFLTMIAKFCLL